MAAGEKGRGAYLEASLEEQAPCVESESHGCKMSFAGHWALGAPGLGFLEAFCRDGTSPMPPFPSNYVSLLPTRSAKRLLKYRHRLIMNGVCFLSSLLWPCSKLGRELGVGRTYPPERELPQHLSYGWVGPRAFCE